MGGVSAARLPVVDGFRAIAALGVVFAHAVEYRFGHVPQLHYARMIATPLAQTSVLIFFAISGFIITSLLLGEQERRGQISIRGFYIRRATRILPPFAAYLLAVLVLRWLGAIPLDREDLLFASSFTCNIGECSWWVAHTWSLAVENQFYLAWPMLLVAFGNRPAFIAFSIAGVLLAFLLAPWAWHSNYISFACIGAGALYASSPAMRRWFERYTSDLAWLAAGALLVLGPLFIPQKPIQVITPALILYLLFAVPAFARAILVTKPMQLLGLGSYSLYLWQQAFLAPDNALPLWGLPLVVVASVFLIEKPFIRLGKRLTAESAMAYRSSAVKG